MMFAHVNTTNYESNISGSNISGSDTSWYAGFKSDNSKTILKSYPGQQCNSIQLEYDICYGDTNTYIVDTKFGYTKFGWSSDTVSFLPKPSTPKPSTKLRATIQARQAPLIITTRQPLVRKVDEREQRARDTLRRLVGDNQYRRFLAHGFITVRAKSGKVYQIRPGHGITTVCSSIGKPIERLCVILRGNFPPTDEAITRYLMILNNEDHFRSLAVISPPVIRDKPVLPDQRPLPEIFAMLKRQAAWEFLVSMPAPGWWGRFVFNKIPSRAITRSEGHMQTIKEKITAAKKEKQQEKQRRKDLAEKFKKGRKR